MRETGHERYSDKYSDDDVLVYKYRTRVVDVRSVIEGRKISIGVAELFMRTHPLGLSCCPRTWRSRGIPRGRLRAMTVMSQTGRL